MTCRICSGQIGEVTKFKSSDPIGETNVDLDWYELRSGRSVWLQQLLIRCSCLGIYEGEESRIRRFVLERLPDDARRVFGNHIGVVVNEPPPGTLPAYVVIADFFSSTAVDPSYDCSGLTVCWFPNSFVVTPDMIWEQVRSVDWDAEARDGNY